MIGCFHMDAYRSKDWHSFRREVVRLDNQACTLCGRKESEEVILQVHHKQYLQGRKPWEYPYQLCMTVCKGCHAAEHGIIPPKFGWEHVGWDDLGNLDGTCECCGKSIRYVFLVTHKAWTSMEVGEVCCDNLTSTQVASGVMESRRRYSTRLKTFISSTRWRQNGETRCGLKDPLASPAPADTYQRLGNCIGLCIHFYFTKQEDHQRPRGRDCHIGISIGSGVHATTRPRV